MNSGVGSARRSDLWRRSEVGVDIAHQRPRRWTDETLGAADVVLGRKRYPGTARLAWARRRWPFLLGLGAPVSFVPLLLPFAVVGATLAYLMQAAGRLRLAPRANVSLPETRS